MNKCKNVKYQIPDSAKYEEFYILVFKEHSSEISNLPSWEMYKERVNNQNARCCSSVYNFVRYKWEEFKNEKERRNY